MWTWVITGVGYSVSLFLFQLLGGIATASRAIQGWGRVASDRRLERSGLTASDFARSRLARD